MDIEVDIEVDIVDTHLIVGVEGSDVLSLKEVAYNTRRGGYYS